MKYFKEAKHLWQKYVPKSGQAKTIQGELIRAIEKLRDEAQRNGNINWDDGHKILSDFIERILCESSIFEPVIKIEIQNDIKTLQNFHEPQTEDVIYDRITDRIVEWYLKNTDPIPYKYNSKLNR